MLTEEIKFNPGKIKKRELGFIRIKWEKKLRMLLPPLNSKPFLRSEDITIPRKEASSK